MELNPAVNVVNKKIGIFQLKDKWLNPIVIEDSNRVKTTLLRILYNLPQGVILMRESEEDLYTCIYGNAILGNLLGVVQNEYNGLTRIQQRRVETYLVDIVIIRSGTPEDSVKDILNLYRI